MSGISTRRGFKVEPISWPVVEVERVEIKPIDICPNEKYGVGVPLKEDATIYGVRAKTVGGAVFADMMSADDLPTEFFNHQLLEYDPQDQDSLIQFINDWGMPFSPQRNAKFCLKDWGIIWQLTETGIAETWNLEEALTETDLDTDGILMKMIENGELTQENALDKIMEVNSKACFDTIGNVISLMEASVTLYVLQETVRILTQVERSGSWAADDIDRVLGVLNAGSRNEKIALPATYWYYSEMSNLNTELSSRGNLTPAICNQILACIADEAEWRECACEGCGKLFKRKQSSSSNPDSDSIYCCDKCMERQKKRNQRKAAKNRIKH